MTNIVKFQARCMKPFDKKMEVIGQRIKKARVEAGLTQRELAKACVSTPTMISDVETGKGNPKIATVLSICNALAIEPSVVLNGLDSGN